MTIRKSQMSDGQIVSFLRKRDYRFIKELGQGACGQTVLMHDDVIDQAFVCKKYVPFEEGQRAELFASFVREIKLLHQLHHPNVVRVFNHYIYPEQLAGYILMEYVDGQTIDEYVLAKPEEINDLFIQAIDGFTYLQQQGVLHRDIRPQNLMVTSQGQLKIIDLGFGKRINQSQDFNKSVTLNWWCDVPADFEQKRYDFSTEVYFVGKLFERLLEDGGIQSFKYASQLRSMCQFNPGDRHADFSAIDISIGSDRFAEVAFRDDEIEAYRAFAEELAGKLTKIDYSSTYANDIDKIALQLTSAYRDCMLEDSVDGATVIRCFISGQYYYKTNWGFHTGRLKDFVRLLKSCSDEQKRIILANLQTKLDRLPRYFRDISDDDIPF